MKRYLLSGLLVVGLVVGGLAPRASAQTEDVEVVVGNLPAAGSALVAGLQEALDVLTSTQSAVETSGAVGDALVAAGGALVAGSDQFGALGLGFLLVNSGVQQVLEPFLVLIDDQAPIFDALDDPSMIGDAFNADDLGQLLENLPSVPEAAWEGTPFAFNTGLRDALVEGLQGNIIADGPLPIGASLASSTVWAVVASSETLLEGTNYGSSGANVSGTLGITGLVVLGGASGPLGEVEAALAPLFEGADGAQQPLIDFIGSIDL